MSVYGNDKDLSAVFESNFCFLVSNHQKPCEDYFFPFKDKTLPINIDSLAADQIKGKWVVVLVPGIFGECLVAEIAPFGESKKVISEKYSNVRFVTLNKVSGRASSYYNAGVIHNALQAMPVAADEKLLLMGYSKGTADSLSFLSDFYYNEQVAKSYSLAGFVSLAGVVNGTPIASKSYLNSEPLAASLPLKDCPLKDDSGIQSLTSKYRMQWFAKNAMVFQQSLPMFSLVAASQKKNTSMVFKEFHKDIMQMAGINDGQIPSSHQIIPGSYYLGHVNADHWAVILPFSNNPYRKLNWMNKLVKMSATKNEYPRDILLESLLLTVTEQLNRPSVLK